MAKAPVIVRRPLLSYPPCELADIHALKAVNSGTATPAQQVRFMLWLKRNACMIGGISHVPDEEHGRDSAFNEGRRYVGVIIENLAHDPIEQIRKIFGFKPPTTNRGENQ